MRRLSLSALAVLLAILLLATPPGAAGASSAVSVGDFFFDPKSSVIAVGDQVTWMNKGNFAHVVMWTGGRTGQSMVLNPGNTYGTTFSAAGTYTYVCGIHPTLMSGIVTVGSTPPAPAPTTPPPAPAPPKAPPPAPAPAAPTPLSTTTPQTPSPTPTPTLTPQASSSPAAAIAPAATPTLPAAPISPAAAPPPQSNTTLGIALIVLGSALLGATLWWRFLRPR